MPTFKNTYDLELNPAPCSFFHPFPSGLLLRVTFLENNMHHRSGKYCLLHPFNNMQFINKLHLSKKRTITSRFGNHADTNTCQGNFFGANLVLDKRERILRIYTIANFKNVFFLSLEGYVDLANPFDNQLQERFFFLSLEGSVISFLIIVAGDTSREQHA